ncbi:PHP domain-containing protein [Clostridium baratii]|uniref:PHP domain-containing protein n=1 Tax=Clostridium baratii TaxID=1561 RepID=UPI0030D1F5F9
MRIEMHVHTRFSKDSLQPLYILLIMCKIRKIKCIAITDHNEIIGAIKAKSIFKKYNIDVIVGEEIFTKDGEIIGLFLKEKIASNLSAKETINQIKKQNGIVYVPHPFDIKRKKTVLKYEEIISNKDDIQLIECFNGRNIKEEYSVNQNNIAEKIRKTKVIGSDAHTWFEIGRNTMEIEAFKNKEEFLENIKKAKFNTKKCINIAHTVTKFVNIIKMMLKGDLNGINRIIVRKFKRTE